jgi:kumamolisin
MASRSKSGAGKSSRKTSAAARKAAPGRRVTVAGSKRGPVKDASFVGKADPRSKVEVTVTLRGPKLPRPDQFLRRSFSPAKFRERYGASKRDVDKVSQLLRREGMTIEEVSRGTRSIRVSGTVAQMECVFAPGLCIYKNKELGEFRDREQEYKVPLSLKSIITAVLGFGERPVLLRKPTLKKKRIKRRMKRPRIGAGLHQLGPEELEKLYRFPPGSAAGQKIAIAEFGGGYFGEDVRLFCRRYRRPEPRIRTIPVNAPVRNLAQIESLPPGERSAALGDASEVMMDVEIIAGLCPSAEISVYFATEDQKGWLDLLERVIKDRPAVLSVSWGSAEDSTDWSLAARKAINERLQMAAALGITICIAAGDDGTGDEQTDGHAHLDFPSSSPYVLTVGGTMLKHERGKITEQAWWESPGKRTDRGGGSTGGGVSTRLRRQNWQDVKIVSVNNVRFDGRVVPDVAALAGPPGYDMIFRGKTDYGAGTSASAPLWAGLIARIYALLPPDKRQRFLTPLLYEKRQGRPLGSIVCQDITIGHNTSDPPGVGYHATEGFDAVSGWGTPIGTALLLALS